MSGDRDERIRQRAHEIWEKEGRPEGEGYRHWAEAEREIDAEGQRFPKKPAVRSAAAKKPAAPKAAKAPARKPTK